MMDEQYLDQPSHAGVAGYIMKYPSEGSNVMHLDEAAYPAKCTACHNAWATTAADMRKHRRNCVGQADMNMQDVSKLGPPRQYWLEIDYEQHRLQWRETFDADQNPAFVLRLDSILNVTPIDDKAFVVMDSTRQITLQASDTEERDRWLNALVELIFQHGKPPSIQHAEQLVLAIRQGDITKIDLLLAENPQLATSVMDEGRNSLLLIACKVGAGIDVVSMLLDHGVDCNVSNNNGETPLLILAAAGDTKIVSLLIKNKNLDLNSRGLHGMTALHAATSAGEALTMRILLEAGIAAYAIDNAGQTALHYAAACECGEVALHLLCEIGESELIDAQDYSGDTALHVACRHGYFNNVRSLVETAASVHLHNHKGNTPADEALAHDHEDCYELVLEYVSDPGPRLDFPPHEQVPPPAPGHVDIDTPNYPYFDEPTEQVAEGVWYADKNEDVWETAFTEDGYIYYFNEATGETSWYNPLGGDDECRDDHIEDVPVVVASNDDTIFTSNQSPRFYQSTRSSELSLLCPSTPLENAKSKSKFVQQRKRAREKRRQKRRTKSTELRAQVPS